MAGLSSRKSRRSAAEENSAVDQESLQAFYRVSDDVVDEHFSATLHDDLRDVLGHGNPAEEDWDW